MSSDGGRGEFLLARVRFLTTREGGRLTSPVTGVRSQFMLASGEMTSCVVSSIGTEDVLPLGDEVDVRIQLLFPEVYLDEQRLPESVRLFEGNKLVAVGSFLGPT